MVLKKERLLKTVLDALSILRSSCEDRGKSGLFDLNTIAEDFFCPFLNEMYGLNLVTLGRQQTAIDLADRDSGTAYQITSNGSKLKIQSTLDKYAEHKLFRLYPNLRVVVIGKRRNEYALTIPRNVRFDPDKDILDVATLGAAVRKLKTAQVERLAQIVESEFEKSISVANGVEVPLAPLEVSMNGESIQEPNASFTFLPEAGWAVDLVLRNASKEVLEPGDFSIALVLPPKLYIHDEWSSETPKFSYPVRLNRLQILYEMTHFDKLLPGVTKSYGIPLKTHEEKPLKVGESAKAIVRVHTRHGNAEYPVKIDAVTKDENVAAVRKRKKRASLTPNEHAVLKLSSFIRALEGESKNNLPSVSWIKTFGSIDPECKKLTKKDIIPRIFSTSNRKRLITYLDAVKGMYAVPMKRKDVREKFSRVCEAFGIDINELV